MFCGLPTYVLSFETPDFGVALGLPLLMVAGLAPPLDARCIGAVLQRLLGCRWRYVCTHFVVGTVRVRDEVGAAFCSRRRRVSRIEQERKNKEGWGAESPLSLLCYTAVLTVCSGLFCV
jgi:hypothetical protein